MTEAAKNFLELSLAFQIAIGAGYLAYMTAYAGLTREHKAIEQIAITFVFSAIGLAVAEFVQAWGSIIQVAVTLLAVFSCALIWRKFGRTSWQTILRILKIHREDGIYTGWSAFVQTNLGVSQATIYLASGEILFLEDRTKYKKAPWQGLYLCGDGSVSMVVDEVTSTDGTVTKRESICDEDWGTRVTYIPASQIERVELRMK